MEKITVSNEIEGLIPREQICSELGALSEEAMKIGRQVEGFVREKLREIVEDETLRDTDNNWELEINETPEE